MRHCELFWLFSLVFRYPNSYFPIKRNLWVCIPILFCLTTATEKRSKARKDFGRRRRQTCVCEIKENGDEKVRYQKIYHSLSCRGNRLRFRSRDTLRNGQNLIGLRKRNRSRRRRSFGLHFGKRRQENGKREKLSRNSGLGEQGGTSLSSDIMRNKP